MPSPSAGSGISGSIKTGSFAAGGLTIIGSLAGSGTIGAIGTTCGFGGGGSGMGVGIGTDGTNITGGGLFFGLSFGS